MINIVILWLTGGNKITLFIFLNLGSLLSEFTSNDNLTSFNLFNFHNVSDNEHSSRSRWSLLHHLGLKEFNLSTSRKGLIKDHIKLDDNITLRESISSLDEFLELIGFLSIRPSRSSSVDNLDNNSKIGGRLFDNETRVTSSYEGSLEELVDFSLEDSVSNELSSLREDLTDFKI